MDPILVKIRMDPIRDPAPDPALFVRDLQDANQKNFTVFLLIFRDKKSLRSNITLEIKVFLTIFA
jgi:hypothetical protein